MKHPHREYNMVPEVGLGSHADLIDKPEKLLTAE